MIVALVVVVAAVMVSLAISVELRRRSGVLRDVSRPAELATTDLGLSRTGPTVVQFTAVWCGPCAAVRRVVSQVCADLDQVAHVEIDMDANPAAARRLSVLSLPTTFIFDAEGRQRYRTVGVPRPADLKAALQPLLA